MQRRNLVLLSILLGGAAVVGVACGSSEQSGACNGTEDGTYFQLQQYNFVTTGALEIRVNGRFVGNVPAATTNPSTGAINPGQQLLGEFPVCDALEIDARGTGIVTTKACSTSVFTSPACRAQRSDYCWETFFVIDGSAQPTPPPDVKTPQCDDPSAVPTGSPDKCSGEFVPC